MSDLKNMARRDRPAPVIHENGFTVNGCDFRVHPKYKPIKAIGQGSYGVVCAVVNAQTQEKLAIKKITPMAGDDWDATHTLREIRLMRCLGTHENIISLKDLDVCEEKDELYMMMDLADTDLHRLIQSSCPLTDGHVRVIMFQILSGVKAMHDNGVLHRDLKPGNLLLNKDCELKITDFGLARMMPRHCFSQTETDHNVAPMTEYVVTRWYRAPELMLAPNGCYDGAVDIWSVGCIFGELLTRKPLFPGKDFIDQLTRIFLVIPLPEAHERGYNIDKDAQRFLSTLSTTGDAFNSVFAGIAPDAVDLIKQLLQFNPHKRITVDRALEHPFFDGVHEEWGDIASLKLKHSIEISFDQNSLSLAKLRECILQEVDAFKGSKQSESAVNVTPVLASRNEIIKDSSTSEAKPTTMPGDCKPDSGFSIKQCKFHVPERYKPIDLLGKGSYGIVCSVVDTYSNTKIAIKKLTPMAGDDWDARHTLREIRLMRYFGNHPNIAKLQDLSMCLAKDELYMYMELVDTDLHRLLKSRTKLQDHHVSAIMYQLLSGACCLHSNGVLHRDLKPGNLLISKHCDVKITDFGLSRLLSQENTESEPSSNMTEYVVTRWYRPPEIMLAPSGKYDAAVDMWSIGCIFAEILLRKPLFPGSDFMDQLKRVFSILPLPDAKSCGYKLEVDALKFVSTLSPCSPYAFRQKFEDFACPKAMDLLRQMLCVNPKQRISAKDALQHPYFQRIRQQLGEPPTISVTETLDFEFEKQSHSLTQLRHLIQEEVGLMQTRKMSGESAIVRQIHELSTRVIEVWDTPKGSTNNTNSEEDSHANDGAEDPAQSSGSNSESDENETEADQVCTEHASSNDDGNNLKRWGTVRSKDLRGTEDSNLCLEDSRAHEERDANRSINCTQRAQAIASKYASSKGSSQSTDSLDDMRVLPSEWERRADEKTGRFYYINTASKKVFEKLPSSVSASLLTARRNDRRRKDAKKLTVPQSPNFSKMSWQRRDKETSSSQANE